ncbi:MAG TPA: DUF6178 family protein [Polyangium sp.]|nr:DUF6178 family protein [Polyangium sp.]
MKTSLLRSSTSKSLLTRWIDMPDLVQNVRALPPPTFSTLVRHIGVEDAGELVALATTEQLVAAFDEDLFTNVRPGERETFDPQRFVTWLEVLLEAGDDIAATKIAALSEDFVIQAVSNLVLVLDHDALMTRMSEGGDDVEVADKAIESCLSEEIDGYLLVSREHDGWDSVLTLILALDRDHRPLLVRVLDRCADMASGYIDDLDELAELLSASESLAEEVEAEREDRRNKQGFVEPRAARNFLTLAKTPLEDAAATKQRDPVTRAYFRDLEPVVIGRTQTREEVAQTSRLLNALSDVVPEMPRLLPAVSDEEKGKTIVAAMRVLGEDEPLVFQVRMDEFAYLTNVVLAGASKKDGRFELAEAAEAVLATVALGAELVAQEKRGKKRTATVAELHDVLRDCHADLLFRKASSTLVAQEPKRGKRGLVKNFADLKIIRRILCGAPKKKRAAAT